MIDQIHFPFENTSSEITETGNGHWIAFAIVAALIVIFLILFFGIRYYQKQKSLQKALQNPNPEN
jgi:hypothetical protein